MFKFFKSMFAEVIVDSMLMIIAEEVRKSDNKLDDAMMPELFNMRNDFVKKIKKL